MLVYLSIREFPHLQRSGALEKATSGLQSISDCTTPMNMLLAINDSYVTIEKVRDMVHVYVCAHVCMCVRACNSLSLAWSPPHCTVVKSSK